VIATNGSENRHGSPAFASIGDAGEPDVGEVVDDRRRGVADLERRPGVRRVAGHERVDRGGGAAVPGGAGGEDGEDLADAFGAGVDDDLAARDLLLLVDESVVEAVAAFAELDDRGVGVDVGAGELLEEPELCGGGLRRAEGGLHPERDVGCRIA
jgi:hypothetical protein